MIGGYDARAPADNHHSAGINPAVACRVVEVTVKLPIIAPRG
jgi:hypothetical protein